MATETPNLGLRKPSNADTVNVATDISANMDLIDAAVAQEVTDRQAADALKANLEYSKLAGDSRAGVLEWAHKGDTAYLFHLTTGTGYSADPQTGALIGIGIGDGDGLTLNDGGIGILLSNKKSGQGITGSNNATITSTTAYLMHLRQNSMAPLVFLEQTTNSVAELLVLTCNTGAPSSGQMLQRWQSVGGGGNVNFGYDCGRVYAQSGRLEWFKEIRANGSLVMAHTEDTTNSAIGSLLVSGTWIEPTGLRARKYTGSAATFYNVRLLMGSSAGPNFAALQASQSFGSNYGSESWASMIEFDNTKIGFFGATPVVKPTSTTDLRTALINLGLYTTGGATPLNLNGGAFTTTGQVNTGQIFSNSLLRLDGGDSSGNVVAYTGTLPMTLLANRSIALVTNQVGTAGGYPVTVRPANSGQTANLMEWQDSTTAVLSTISENGYFTTRKTSAPADAELSAGELAIWFDSTNGAAKFMVKAKQADGTVRTGSVALA